MPSESMVKAMAFFANERSEVTDANRGTSWFSMKEPRREVLVQVDFMVFMPLARVDMLPEVDSKAWMML